MAFILFCSSDRKGAGTELGAALQAIFVKLGRQDRIWTGKKGAIGYLKVVGGSRNNAYFKSSDY